jgi:hypothetical protein
MILSTIALIWLATAAVFVLALAMAAAKPMPLPESSTAHGSLDASVEEASPADEDQSSVLRLPCGRSMTLCDFRPLSKTGNPQTTGRLGGIGELQAGDDSKRAVSF